MVYSYEQRVATAKKIAASRRRNGTYKHTEEWKKQHSEQLKGRKMSATAVERSRLARTGIKRTPEQCMAQSLRQKGKFTGYKNPNYGNRWTEEQRKRASDMFRGKNLGKDNPNYKGGNTKLIICLRTNIKMQEWRMLVFQKNNFICQRCFFAKSGHLVSHHLVNLCTLIKQYHIHSIDEAIVNKELWRTDNGVTLCHNCHMEFHNQYGRFHNTPNQMQAFLQPSL
jgi:hypothetical protein